MSNTTDSVTVTEAQELLSRWWFNYDEANFDVLADLLSEDIRFTSRTDSGATDFEEFIRADVAGRDAVMVWQTEHRLGSPSPLRHNGTNFHLTGGSGDEVTFASYIFVTHVVGMFPSNLSSGICGGTVRREGSRLRLAELEVVLDMTDSVPLSERG